MKNGPNLEGLKAILRFARDQQIDIIHSHGYKANILLGLVPSRYRPSALVCTLHGWTSSGRLGKLSFYEWLEKRIICRFDGVVIVSERMRESLRNSWVNDKLTMIINGVNVRNGTLLPDRAEERKNQSAKGKLWRIFAAGRLSHEKGFDLLLEAIGKLKSRGLQLHLTIAGEGPERLPLERQIAHGYLQDDVELVGFQEDLVPLFGRSDLFVLSSRTEGLPLVLLEAMTWGVPVVATPVGEISNVLENGKCGWLTRDLSPEAIAETIQLVISQDGRSLANTKNRARDRVNRHYSSAAMAGRYRSLYREVLIGGR